MSIPLFKSSYSIGRSILTCEEAGKSSKTEPDSIIDLAVAHGLNKVFLLEDCFSSFLEAYKNCNKAKMSLAFGIKVTVVPDAQDKTESSLSKGAKFAIFAKNKEGYERLIKIWSATKDGFYYEPRLDFKTIKSLWNEKSLSLVIPFYDSFLFNNLFRGTTCVPDIDFTRPIFALENNGLPFDAYLKEKVLEFCGGKNEVINTKSIYYAKRDDFLSYLTFRCLNKRSVLEKPELEHMTSAEFCMEAWAQENKSHEKSI